MTNYTSIERLNDLKSGLKSVTLTLTYEMELWERKEYEAVKSDYISEIENIEKNIAAHPEVFENL
jgi:hypothetical protein